MVGLISYPRKLRCQDVKLYKDKELELLEPKPIDPKSIYLVPTMCQVPCQVLRLQGDKIRNCRVQTTDVYKSYNSVKRAAIDSKGITMVREEHKEKVICELGFEG